MKLLERAKWPREPRAAAVWVATTAGVVAALVGGYVKGAGTFSEQRAALSKQRETYRATLLGIREERKDRPELDQKLQAFFDRTLGPDIASTDSALRSRLNRIGEELRIKDLRVATGTSTARQSPAKSEFSRSGRERAFHDEVDFVELQATISGEGSLDEVLRLVHRLEVEPWLKRIDSVGMEQVKGGSRVRASVRLSTLFVPEKKGKAELKPTDEDVAGFDAYASIAAANPFSIPQAAAPAPPTPAVAPPPPTPPPSPGFPYEQWRLTGLVSGPLGLEAWLRNAATGETRQLAPGQQVGELVFVGGEGDSAAFDLGAVRVLVPVGGDLAKR